MGCCDNKGKCHNDKKAKYRDVKDESGEVVRRYKSCLHLMDNHPNLVDKKCKKNSDCRIENFKNMKLNNLCNYSATGDLVCNIRENFNDSNDVSNWIHKPRAKVNNILVADEDGPVYTYHKIVKDLRKPDVIANQPGGIAIWYMKQKDGIHHTIELRDEYVSHCLPAQHYDFLISYINVFVPPAKLNAVMNVSGSVGYDGLKKLLSARCASFEANMATLATCLKVINGKADDYSKNINNRYTSFEENKEYIKKEIARNHTVYAKALTMPFCHGAFPHGCK